MTPRRAHDTERRAFTLLELLTVITIMVVLAGLVIGVGRRASVAGKAARAKTELMAIGAALEAYRRTYGDYPQTDDEARLLQSLIGKKGPTDGDITGRSQLETARFTFANSSDPPTNPTAVLVDPWGQPYLYAYKVPLPWNNSSYVLYSIGPDGQDSPALVAGGFADVAPAANTDNIHANR